ncbi:MAG: hypothetical protein V1825_04560, partial [Candidatus Falkowbacteria bacterium]
MFSNLKKLALSLFLPGLAGGFALAAAGKYSAETAKGNEPRLVFEEARQWQIAADALSFKKGSFAKKTSTGTQPIAGVGFQPKAIIFYWTNQTAEGISNTSYYGTGFASSTTAERAISSWSDDGTSSDSGRKGSQTYCVMIQLINGGDGGTAELNSFDVDGFTLNWVTADASAYIIHYVALGGADITNAQAGTF